VAASDSEAGAEPEADSEAEADADDDGAGDDGADDDGVDDDGAGDGAEAVGVRRAEMVAVVLAALVERARTRMPIGAPGEATTGSSVMSTGSGTVAARALIVSRQKRSKPSCARSRYRHASSAPLTIA
jgi:hypothetical protein